MMQLHRPRQEDRGYHPQLNHPVPHGFELESNNLGHLDHVTGTIFPTALRVVQIVDAEICTVSLDQEREFAAVGRFLMS
jgi:hypothetical protein